MASYVQNMFAKGSAGKRKHYFTGKRRKKQKTKTEQVSEGDVVVFESRDRLFKGVICGRSDDDVVGDCYVIKPDTDSERKDFVPYNSNVKPLSELHLAENDIAKGLSVLVTWEELDGFISLEPAVILEVCDTHCWVKAKDGNAQQVNKDEMCRLPRKDLALPDDEAITCTVDESNINVIRLVLHTTQQQLVQVTETYHRTKQELSAVSSNGHELASKNIELNNICVEAIEKVQALEKQLSSAVTKSRGDHTLYNVISEQKQMLDYQSMKIIALEKQIITLREEHQTQQASMATQIQVLQEENAQLQQTITATGQWVQQASKPGIVKVRGGLTKPTSYLQVDGVTKRSTCVDRKTLKKRSEKLNEVSESNIMELLHYRLITLSVCSDASACQSV